VEPYEVWNSVLERAGNSLARLAPNERIIYRVNVFLCDLEMGGLSGFLYNVSPTDGGSWSDLRETAEAIETVGHLGCAATLRDLAERLERLPSFSTTWDAFLAPLREHLESNVGPVVNGYIGDLYADLETFTIRHFS
jgi:hypothetical protein